MNLLRSEQREMHRQVDAIVGEFHTIMKDPAVKDAFGNIAEPLSDLADNLYVPNIRHGRITAPRQHRPARNPDGLPIFIGDSNQDYSIDGALLAPTRIQSFRMQETFDGWGLDKSASIALHDRIEANIVNATSIIDHPSKGTEAHVQSLNLTLSEIAPEKGIDRRKFKSRPLTAFWSEASGKSISQRPFQGLVLLHELVHLRDELVVPIINPKTAERERMVYSQELEAYHYQAVAVTALYNASANPRFKDNDDLERFTHVLDINLLRQEENKDSRDAFKATGRLINRLDSMGLDIVLQTT